MAKIELSPSVRQKLVNKRPPVTEAEVLECLANRSGIFLTDTREKNRTDPPTLWFIAPTDSGRLLKVCFLQRESDGVIVIKTAYEPNAEERRIYRKYGDD